MGKAPEPAFECSDGLRKCHPELCRAIEEGLQGADRAGWSEAGRHIVQGSGGFTTFFLGMVPKDPRAICWLVAALHYEYWSCGTNPVSWLRSLLRKIPDVEGHLASLESMQDPWIVKMAGWGKRVLTGKDQWIGAGQSAC